MLIASCVAAVYFAATREELEKGGEALDNLAELIDGGYVATIGAYHELHCIVCASFFLPRHRDSDGGCSAEIWTT